MKTITWKYFWHGRWHRVIYRNCEILEQGTYAMHVIQRLKHRAFRFYVVFDSVVDLHIIDKGGMYA